MNACPFSLPFQDWTGVAQPHIEYIVKIAIDDDDSKIKCVGKRYSDLSDLHKLLVGRRLIRGETAPAFPDKNHLHDQWWKLDARNPSSDFVKQRKVKNAFKSTSRPTYPPRPFGLFWTVGHLD